MAKTYDFCSTTQWVCHASVAKPQEKQRPFGHFTAFLQRLPFLMFSIFYLTCILSSIWHPQSVQFERRKNIVVKIRYERNVGWITV